MKAVGVAISNGRRNIQRLKMYVTMKCIVIFGQVRRRRARHGFFEQTLDSASTCPAQGSVFSEAYGKRKIDGQRGRKGSFSRRSPGWSRG